MPDCSRSSENPAIREPMRILPFIQLILVCHGMPRHIGSLLKAAASATLCYRGNKHFTHGRNSVSSATVITSFNCLGDPLARIENIVIYERLIFHIEALVKSIDLTRKSLALKVLEIVMSHWIVRVYERHSILQRLLRSSGDGVHREFSFLLVLFLRYEHFELTGFKLHGRIMAVELRNIINFPNAARIIADI